MTIKQILNQLEASQKRQRTFAKHPGTPPLIVATERARQQQLHEQLIAAYTRKAA